MRHRESNVLKYQTYCEGVTILPRNTGECGLSLSRGGLSSEGVELCGWCEGPFSLRDHQLPLLDHVHEFHTSQGRLRGRKGLEPQHRTRHPLHGSMVLFDNVV